MISSRLKSEISLFQNAMFWYKLDHIGLRLGITPTEFHNIKRLHDI